MCIYKLTEIDNEAKITAMCECECEPCKQYNFWLHFVIVYKLCALYVCMRWCLCISLGNCLPSIWICMYSNWKVNVYRNLSSLYICLIFYWRTHTTTTAIVDKKPQNSRRASWMCLELECYLTFWCLLSFIILITLYKPKKSAHRHIIIWHRHDTVSVSAGNFIIAELRAELMIHKVYLVRLLYGSVSMEQLKKAMNYICSFLVCAQIEETRTSCFCVYYVVQIISKIKHNAERICGSRLLYTK